MNNEFNNDEMDETEEPTAMQKAKEWTQENLRILVSVLIVLLIALSIYSYSKRGTETEQLAQNDDDGIENILSDLIPNESDENTSEEMGETDSNRDTTVEQDSPKAETPTTGKADVPAPSEEKQDTPQINQTQETESSFIEVAQAGDGTTHLARKALANYLEKNTDSSLTAEHKIYIEDYLRKNISTTGHVAMGSSVEFSKSLIKQAIDASKNLNDGQLKNLQKYSANVNF